jgi:hypothetical protein
VNLIILDSKGIDIILGMDWLGKYNMIIRYAKRAIRLTKEDGTIVEFIATMQADQASLLSQVQETTVDEIRVVQEYPEVLPEIAMHLL